MNVYEMLRAIVTGKPFDPVRASKLIDELERIYPEFGQVRDHPCEPRGLYFPDSLLCGECMGAVPCRAHTCEAGWDQMTSTGEYGQNVKYALKCVVCGREMTPEEVYGAR